jgi:TPR repeat protein
MKHILATVFVCVLLVTSACSRFDESVAAYEGGNYTAALWEWQRLAKAGYSPALYNLGVMYYEGKGVPQDTVQAYMWFNLAAGQGYEYALDSRQLVADEMTAAQFVEAQRRTREWWLLSR